jgi:apolipoprotein N-acyltransferase
MENEITSTKSISAPLGLVRAFGFVTCAVITFTLAYSIKGLGFLIVFFPYCLLNLARLGTDRRAFYLGLVTGLVCYAIELSFFWHIFGSAAISLWVVLACWLGLFVLLARQCLTNCRDVWAAVLIPFLWTGLEYFRSELYYLRFSWLNVGYALSNDLSLTPLSHLGIYGTGFLAVAIGSAASFLSYRKRIVVCLLGLVIWFGLSDLANLFRRTETGSHETSVIQVAGVQMEFPSQIEILFRLNKLLKQFPQAQLLVLSEYTLDGAVPDKIMDWCRDNQRYLIVGGKDPAPGSNFYNTAFVVDPSGKVIFRQVKTVPIQFFKDGLPAPEQKLWTSPWGNIGICICYDLSYSRVTDRLIRLGAQALIVPTMDVESWGKHEHELHERVALIRAAEYGVPIFRVASSGISQLVDGRGRQTATAPFPGDGTTIHGELRLSQTGRRPLDRVLALVSVAVTAGFVGLLALRTASATARRFRGK